MKLMGMKHNVIVAETADDIILLAGAAGLTAVGPDGSSNVITIHDQASGEIELLQCGEEALMVSHTAVVQSWSVVEIEEISLDFKSIHEFSEKYIGDFIS